jgi:hypothetical protein
MTVLKAGLLANMNNQKDPIGIKQIQNKNLTESS